MRIEPLDPRAIPRGPRNTSLRNGAQRRCHREGTSVRASRERPDPSIMRPRAADGRDGTGVVPPWTSSVRRPRACTNRSPLPSRGQRSPSALRVSQIAVSWSVASPASTLPTMAIAPRVAARALVARLQVDAQRAHAERKRVRERAREVAAWLRDHHGAARVFLVGSFAWGEADAASDVDLVADDVPEASRGAIEAECSRRIGRTVELRRLCELDDGFRARVLAENEIL